MKIPTKCTLHNNIDGLRCMSDAVEWFAWTDSVGGEYLSCRCDQHVGVILSLTNVTVFNTYEDAIVYAAMREL